MGISQDSWNGYYNSYFFGEAKGSELIAKLEEFAPGEDEKRWVKVWSMEEGLHHRLWADLAEKKKIPIKSMEGTTASLFRITEDFVSKKDWIGSMVSAAIIEHVSTAAALYLYKHADDDTRRVFRRIVGDDVGHLNFDLVELEKAAQTAEGRKKILDAHKVFLKDILSWPDKGNMLDGEMDILNDAYETHRSRLARFGVNLPRIKFGRGLGFRLKRRIISMMA
jgi:hypothetical protein